MQVNAIFLIHFYCHKGESTYFQPFQNPKLVIASEEIRSVVWWYSLALKQVYSVSPSSSVVHRGHKNQQKIKDYLW